MLGLMRSATPCLMLRPAIALMMYTGLGPKDALRLPRSFFKQSEIATRRSKTGEPVFLACAIGVDYHPD